MKGRIIYFVASSLDGYIARKDGSIDWLFNPEQEDYGFDTVYTGVDTVAMGGKTYRHSLELSPNEFPFTGKDCYVFTRDKNAKDDENMKFVTENPADFMRKLRDEGRNIWFVGGAEIAADLLEEGLIDMYFIGVHPILLGSGVPLFPENNREQNLVLHKCDIFSSGLVMMVYSSK